MTDGQTIWLAVIAVSVMTMALVQVAVVVAAAVYARQAARSVQELRREVRPLLDKVNRIADDAGRAAALAAGQAERIDRLMAMTAQRIDETVSVVQGAIIEPVRQGAAAISAFRAALAVFRGWQDRGRHHRDDDEALFVG